MSRLAGAPRARLRQWLQERVFTRRVGWTAGRPVYTFSFDDAPASAGDVGARLVEEAGGRATFYAAGRLAEKGRDAGYLDLGDLRALAARGHQVACHTYTHTGLRGESAESLRWDAAKNRQVLSEALEGAAVEDFAWPYGETSLRAKRHLVRSYRTLRTAQPGFHCGAVDLGALRAVALYGPGFSRERALVWIDRCAARKGWLIFYTHGVDPEPDRHGTRPDDLSWILRECSARGELRTLRDARNL